MRLRHLLPALFATTALWASSAHATVVLDFAGLDGSAHEWIADYYNGGTGNLGSGPGANYGVSFLGGRACDGANKYSPCSTLAAPGGPGANAMYFDTSAPVTMNVAGGFTTGLAFFYAAPWESVDVDVWDGLNGKGNRLATLHLKASPGAGIDTCFQDHACPYIPAGLKFDGVAKSVNFNGYLPNFALITLGSNTPGGDTDVPEPASLLLVGAGLAALAKRRRQ